MVARAAALKVLAKMALSDGVVSPGEREFLCEFMSPDRTDEEYEAVISEARTRSLEELLGDVHLYEDAFFIALRAYFMAHVDHRFDAAEAALFDRLVEILGISASDRRLIERTCSSQNATEPAPVESRIEQLYGRSSFAGSA